MSTGFQILSSGCRYEEKAGRWYATAANGNTCDLETAPVAFFPLLERSARELIAAHPDAASFPFKMLVHHAAASPSSYWQELALDRIEELHLQQDCFNILPELTRSGLSQRIRHKAMKMLKEAERDRDT